MNVRLFAPAFAVMALAACNNHPANNTMTGDNAMMGDNMASAGMANDMAMGNSMAMTNDTAMANGTAAPIPSSPQDYVKQVASVNAFEIAAAKVAQDTSTNQKVKDYAKMLVTDHEKANTELKTAAGKVQPAVDVPTSAMTPEQQANLTKLKGTAAADFDQTYLQMMVDGHTKALAMLQGYAQNGTSDPLKQNAATLAPTVNKHLEQAKQLMQS